jgi:hypothetical protein
VQEIEIRNTVRAAARAYEKALPPQQRKRLGQYFTGLPLGKLLAHLALDPEMRTVLDPMAGHGDLLDATWQAAHERGITLSRLDGIEIDDPTAAACRRRLTEITDSKRIAQQIICADAFDPHSIEALAFPNYDLVITNPPYIRYQAHNTNGAKWKHVRSGATAIIDNRLSGTDRDVWKTLVEGYAGLADLSVPAWLLAAAFVRPNGRLALVVPATWRSRDYADVIRYLMLRCFSLECIIEDTQPGWFSDALVRTHLIVARRLSPEDIANPLGAGTKLTETLWLQVAPQSAGANSLIAAAFDDDYPEAEFAKWVRSACIEPKKGIDVRRLNLRDERAALETRVGRRPWYRKLETHADDLPLFVGGRSISGVTLPPDLKSLLPVDLSLCSLMTLEEAGIHVSQGLRTGCNRFFYVTAHGPSPAGMIRVEASSFLGPREFCVPSAALRPVLRRQSEIRSSLEGKRIPQGRVLDLRKWVLPEDFTVVAQAAAAYVARGETLPQIMPDELAAYVRSAAAAPAHDGDPKRIPDLSAVRTNVRSSQNSHVIPRFWYMLPDFAPRHLPAAFAARINHGLPWIEANFDPPLLIDANFSTFWPSEGSCWTPSGLKALLNSIWCRAFMETLGTLLGGGALKLEATHLRQLVIPILSDVAKDDLDAAGKQLTKTSTDVQARVDAIVLNAVLSHTSSPLALQLADTLAHRAHKMSCARKRAAS